MPTSSQSDLAAGSAARRVGRLRELDALRGVAAASVVLHHSAIAFPVMFDDTRGDGVTAANVLKYTPLHALFAGNPAVIVFFVLSGLVLALPFVEGRGDRYPGFIVKRIFRLWPPYAVAVAAAILLAVTVGGGEVGGMSSWFNEKWHEPVTAGLVAGHASLVASFDNDAFNSPIWSLVIEMRVSLIFPALVLATLLLGWKRGLALALLVCCVGVLARGEFGGGDYFATLKYIPCFVIGILLAAHRESLRARLERLGAGAVAIVASIAALAYTWQFWANADWFPGPLGGAVHNQVVDLVAVTLGATLIILLVQRPGRSRDALLSRVPQFLGRISYSLYLVHLPVLLAVVHLLGGAVEPVLLLPLVWVLSIVLADISQRFVERPAQGVGRRLAAHPAISRPDSGVGPVLAESSTPR
ncbi:MAG TPA: acyltransferase [Solirubrobacteraceae bacterium]|nr:acyltransferase [Solirubrobacteraceae bacterium]